jgi:hypothetical protein
MTSVTSKEVYQDTKCLCVIAMTSGPCGAQSAVNADSCWYSMSLHTKNVESGLQRNR